MASSLAAKKYIMIRVNAELVDTLTNNVYRIDQLASNLTQTSIQSNSCFRLLSLGGNKCLLRLTIKFTIHPSFQPSIYLLKMLGNQTAFYASNGIKFSNILLYHIYNQDFKTNENNDLIR
jgi:hypothetical protein